MALTCKPWQRSTLAGLARVADDLANPEIYPGPSTYPNSAVNLAEASTNLLRPSLAVQINPATPQGAMPAEQP